MDFVITTDPTPPHSGDDKILLTLTDSVTHAPIPDANVSATADMKAPSIPGQMESGRARGNGLYEIPARLPIASDYSVRIHVERNDHPPAEILVPLTAEH